MKGRRDGTIVIVSSVGGLRGDAKLGAYGISKAADIQLVRSLTAELGPYNIRSNCVAPAIVKTDFARALWEDPQRTRRRCAPIRWAGSASRRTCRAWWSCLRHAPATGAPARRSPPHAACCRETDADAN